MINKEKYLYSCSNYPHSICNLVTVYETILKSSALGEASLKKRENLGQFGNCDNPGGGLDFSKMSELG